MVKFRLQQTGTKNRKNYRIVVMEDSKRRDGRAIEILGYYNPLIKPPHIVIKRDRVSHWIGLGAQLTDGVNSILSSSV